eukprot:gene39852-53888_t
MLKIRLARGGAKKRPYYSIVVADSHSPRDGRFIEKVGTYNPLLPKDGPTPRVTLKLESIQAWIAKGAQPTDRVADQNDAHRVIGQSQIKCRVDLVQHPVALGVTIGRSIERDHTDTGFNRVYNLLKRHADPSAFDCLRDYRARPGRGRRDPMSKDPTDLIAMSLDAVVERAGDPAPTIFARLFAELPETEERFARDTGGAIRGEMLAMVFDCLMDPGGPQGWIMGALVSEKRTGLVMGMVAELRDSPRFGGKILWRAAPGTLEITRLKASLPRFGANSMLT